VPRAPDRSVLRHENVGGILEDMGGILEDVGGISVPGPLDWCKPGGASPETSDALGDVTLPPLAALGPW